MTTSLAMVYDGWNGYQTSLVHAVEPLTPAQLAWRPGAKHRSVGELVRHIALGRMNWFMRMDAPGSTALTSQINTWEQDGDGNRWAVEEAVVTAERADELVYWLEATWQMIETTLKTWHVADMLQTYQHTWNGSLYAVSRQWTIWRIVTHDIHHGGELSLMLGMQGIEAFELSALGGHIVLPSLVIVRK